MFKQTNIRGWIVTILTAWCMSAAAAGASVNMQEHYRMKVREFQMLICTYSSHPHIVNNKALALMAELKTNHFPILYFGVWDMYIQSLYYTGEQLKAQNELHKMLDEIKKVDNPEAETHVYIAQGMLQQRFGNETEAEKSLRKGLSICPPLPECRYPRNLLSLYRWLIQTYIQRHSNYEEALKLCNYQEAVYSEIERRKLGDECNRDKVMVLSQRASVLIGLHRNSEAKQLIDSCSPLVRKDVSPVLYIPYYEALTFYYEATADYDKALTLCGILIKHFSKAYKPFQRKYMLARAEILMKAGRTVDAAYAYQAFERFNTGFDHLRIANDIKEMDMQYRVHKMEMQKEKWHNFMILLATGIAVLLIFIVVIIWSYMRTKKRNRILVARLNDIIILRKPKMVKEREENPNTDAILLERLTEYLERDENIGNSTLSIQQAAEDLEVTTKKLTKSVNRTMNISPYEYFTKCRLEVARHKLIERINEPVQSIAFACGFNTARTFQRQFGQLYGMTPTEYRIAYLEKDSET